jgi:hypothetical protein
VAATAKGNGGASAESVRAAFDIDKFEFSFNAQWAVVADRDFRR